MIPELVYFHPEIPGNTGAAIRLCAVTGSKLHLIKPLGFELSETKLKRAGLDYRDLTEVFLYDSFDEFQLKYPQRRIIAFRTQARIFYTDIHYLSDDFLLFGPESVGLPPEIYQNSSVSIQARLPMLPARRSLNLTNTASIALYEAWRQLGFRNQ